jgi:DNA repair protein RadA/Sms
MERNRPLNDIPTTAHFVCVVCGWVLPTKPDKCPQCNQADSFEVSGLRSLSDVSTKAADRMSTGLPGLDRVLGGGIVAGSVILLGGMPGLGKSTLLTQMGILLAEENKRVAYVSAEESLSQMRLRADRLTDELPPELLVDDNTDLADILKEFDRVKPDLVIVDSVQAIHHPQIRTATGGPTMVRGCAERLTAWAKRGKAPVILVGHVNKSGEIAGPRTLEHMVDVTMYLEPVRRFPAQRRLWAKKNRFGATTEEAIYAMLRTGLYERPPDPDQ